MRILAIRGKNLASLAGEFEVDFQAGPLADAGLFAICGPTGAGKSTLLDALCLALYDDTPRLRGADSRGVELPDVGTEKTSPNDRRNLLRRGCGEGWAEVDFVGNDGVAYRARWSVRRARGKIEGKLQQSEMALARLPDLQPVGGHTKGEVQRAVVERIGLSFEQFTRAVLLAQNEFFAFLKAGEDERAALLQTLTGTDRFERISRRAFERNKAEQQKLASLRDRLADQQPLSAEARAEHEVQRSATKATIAALEARDKALAARLAWYEELQRTRTREAAAADALEAAKTRRAEAAGRCSLLARVEAVQPARALTAECDRLAAERERIARQGTAADAAVTAATEARAGAAKRLESAATALAEVEAAQARFAPAIVEARALDTQIGTLAPQHERAVRALDEAAGAATRAHEAMTANAAALQARATELAQAQAWLAAHAGLAPLAESWQRWDALFGAATGAHAEQRAAQADVARLEAEAQTRARALDEAASAQAAAASTLQARAAAAAEADAQVQRFDLDALARRRAALDAQRERLRAASEAWRALNDHHAQRGELETEAKTLATSTREAEARLAATRTERPAAEAAATEAERAWRVVFEATGASVEALRARLEPDTPCPVCGATEHPYATHHPGLDDALARLTENRDARRKAAADLDVAERTLANALAELARRRTQLDARLAALAEQAAGLDAAWREAAAGIAAETETTPPVEAAEVAAWLATLGSGLATAQQQLAEDDARQREATSLQQTARRALDAARESAETAQRTLAQRQADAQATAAALKAAGETQTRAAQRLAATLAQLDAAHPGGEDWRGAWATDPAAYHRARSREAAAWLEKRTAAATAQNEHERLATESRGLAELHQQAESRRGDAARALAELNEALEAKRAARRAVFAGMGLPPATPEAAPRDAAPLGVAEIEAALAEALRVARDRQASEAEALKAAEQRLAAETATRRQLAETAAALATSAEQAAAALADWLAAFNAREAEPVAPADLNALLAHDAAWLAAEREALARLDTAVATAAGALAQAREQREAHESAGAASAPTGEDAPEDNPESLRAALAELRRTIDAAREHLGGIELALRRDDDIHRKSAELVAAIAAQEAAARIWAQMNDLIGSADGKKFRNYAQQMTLDILLAYANAHLDDLARRYRLERVPASLALMVIDRDMGNEPRSVHSLSGGESFLVSLALALGLASLSSHRVRVESLFIDEGFGSLDADTLRVAMDALDSLQAMGRKVGVISHVEEMTERIATRIRVQKLAGGQSRVEVVG